MIQRILLTSWQHILRTSRLSFVIVVILSSMFLTVRMGVFVMQSLDRERDQLVQKFSYPLFLSSNVDLTSPEVIDFLGSIRGTLSGQFPLQTLEKFDALDIQIKKDPSLLALLRGENPLTDIVMIPLYGTDIDQLVALIRGHEPLLEFIQPRETIEKKLFDVQKALADIARLTRMVMVFLISISALMVTLLVVSLRMHIRVFVDEKRVANLVGAHPIWYWWPHIVSVIIYMSISIVLSLLLFEIFRILFA